MPRASIRLGFIGDPHVGRVDRWTSDVEALRLHREVLDQQFEMCRDHRCTHAVILGDTFDKPCPTEEQKIMVMRALSGARDLDCLDFLGNHDVQDASVNSLRMLAEMPAAGGLRHVTFVMRPRMVSLGGWRVLVVPWGCPVPRARETPDLLLFHDAVRGALRENGTASPEGLAGVTDAGCIAVGGHLHVSQRGGSTIFPGTACQLSFGERDPKKEFWHVTLRSGREPAVACVPIPCTVWRLSHVTYDARTPPPVDHPRTFYSLDVSGDRPPPRWMADHPRVVTTYGGSSKKMLQVASRVVSLMDGSSSRGEDDRTLLQRWLRQHSSLDGLHRAQALRIHDRLAKSGSRDDG